MLGQFSLSEVSGFARLGQVCCVSLEGQVRLG